MVLTPFHSISHKSEPFTILIAVGKKEKKAKSFLAQF